MVCGGMDGVIINGDLSSGFDNLTCVRCHDGFDLNEQIVNSSGQVWHSDCFVCSQCLEPFPDGIYFEFEGRKYCEHDFHVLYAPCCNKCNEFIVGRVIKAMNANWHPECFRCELCNKELADIGFLRNSGRLICSVLNEFIVGRVIKAMNANWHPECFRCELCNKELADIGFLRNSGRALCRECNELEKEAGRGHYVCHKCKGIIEEGGHIKYRGDSFHPYHFKCKRCG
ncbi:unnamed protein product [Gongylonema pulchrum]|uniref:LIM domain-containing protein n=1 Tax=Gongylonema pulchrum TaxID=637853 RepID=A0A183E217_9BILA|nr:unnamed protein product [Gongylonema pulchrum]